MAPHWLCWPAIVKHAARHGIKHRRRHRIGRAIKRTAGVVAAKPAAIVWTCVAVPGAIGWLAWPEQPVSAGPTPLSTGAGAPMLAPELPPEFTRPNLFAFAPAPDFTTARQPQPPPERPPEQPTTPVSEPTSIALLATGIAALAVWRFRT